MALNQQQLNDLSDFYPNDAADIETQFSDDVRGNMTWDDLLAAIEQLEPHQRQSSVLLVNKFNGEVYALIDTCLQMNIQNNALSLQVQRNLGELASDEQPLLIF